MGRCGGPAGRGRGPPGRSGDTGRVRHTQRDVHRGIARHSRDRRDREGNGRAARRRRGLQCGGTPSAARGLERGSGGNGFPEGADAASRDGVRGGGAADLESTRAVPASEVLLGSGTIQDVADPGSGAGHAAGYAPRGASGGSSDAQGGGHPAGLGAACPARAGGAAIGGGAWTDLFRAAAFQRADRDCPARKCGWPRVNGMYAARIRRRGRRRAGRLQGPYGADIQSGTRGRCRYSGGCVGV